MLVDFVEPLGSLFSYLFVCQAIGLEPCSCALSQSHLPLGLGIKSGLLDFSNQRVVFDLIQRVAFVNS